MKHINALAPKPYEEPEEPEANDMDVVDEETLDAKDDSLNATQGSSDQPTLF